MKHQSVGRKFGRIKGRRKSFLAILMHNLIMENRIQTTEARAKEIRPRVEKLVTIAKKGDLAALRLDHRAAHRLNAVERAVQVHLQLSGEARAPGLVEHAVAAVDDLRDLVGLEVLWL